MGPVPRERYNAKARQSQAGSHKRKKRNEASAEQATLDANSLIHIPKSKEEREADRKEKLKQELIEQSDSKWNSKKKKRLEKYIDKKLKKEERVQLFEKLSQSQAQIPSSLQLQSSSTLGTGRVRTHQEITDRVEDKEVRRALDGRTGKRKRHEIFDVVDGSDDEGSDVSELADEAPSKSAQISNVTANDTASQPVVGGALKRDANGNVVAPKVRQPSQKNKSVFASWKLKAPIQRPEESDSSFDSSASEDEGDVVSVKEAQEGPGEEEGEDVEEEARVEEGEEEEEDDEGEDDDEDGDEDDSESDDSAEEDEPPPKPKKSLGFKDWALKQLSVAKGYGEPAVSSSADTSDAKKTSPPPLPKKRKIDHPNASQEMRGPLGEDLQLPVSSFASSLLSKRKEGHTKPNITVSRPPDVEEARLLLPVVAEEQPIMEAILLNPVVVICGETGSGKTTQIPQFLYEVGFGTTGSEYPGMIGITQPRRVAAMSMAARVGHELSLTSSKVSYQIRYDATVSADTSIKFMTDGVLLRELAADFLLTRYSVIIIDEAHERSTNTDILIGVLSRVIKLREEIWKEGKEGATPLRLIIMSATLRVSDFAENTTLFETPPPVINVSARQHPVTVHFNRRTAVDYVTEAIRKTIKIHTRLPPGGILVFLTGQNEINGVCRKLEARFGPKALKVAKRKRGLDAEDRAPAGEPSANRVGAAQADVEPEEMELGDSRVDNDYNIDDGDEPEDPDALDSEEEEQLDEELGLDASETESPMHVLPLYSLLPADKQMQVFKPPPPGSRLVVVCTNVAETSLTIPGIRYVVDCGRAKERHYDTTNGIQTFQVDWVSKASAAQRAGRAGRTGPGHCYRLYSSALYEHYFQAFSQPEILRMPIEGVVLQMKSMNIDAVTNFPFPTPPDRGSLRKAEAVLGYLGALDQQGRVTEQGKTMSLFPVSPRYSRMLVSGQQHGCLPYIIAIVSALSVGDPFLHEEALLHENDSESDNEDLSHLNSEKARAKEAARARRKLFHNSQHIHSSLGKYSSDIFKMLSVVGAYEYAGGGHEFCKEHFVRLKAMEEVHKLRAQISAIVHSNFSGVDAVFVPNLQPPSDLQLKVLRQLLCAAFIDQVAVRKDRIQPTTGGTQYASSKNVPYRALGVAEDVYIHPSSVLANVSPPEYVVFTEVVRTSRVWIKGLTVVNPAWLSALGKSSLCTYSKPFKNSSNVQMVIPHFGPDGWQLPAVKAESVPS
ncbi:putative ATP-dependent RNA helicase DHR1 [Marasmius crinis-equi]|uniref:RNA helicase n=1 Tax=Marasmius crinis-equi TaxID=585013 RepID=A0ABR3FUF7_9AGAR